MSLKDFINNALRNASDEEKEKKVIKIKNRMTIVLTDNETLQELEDRALKYNRARGRKPFNVLDRW